jgi:hypothetical protein
MDCLGLSNFEVSETKIAHHYHVFTRTKITRGIYVEGFQIPNLYYAKNHFDMSVREKIYLYLMDKIYKVSDNQI